LRSMRCTTMRLHGRPHAREGPAPLWTRAAGGACACGAARCSDIRGGSCLWRRCAPQGAPCRGAGGQWVRRAQGGMQPRRRIALCACRAAVLPGIRSLATTTEAVGTLLGFRHTARRRVRRAVCEERGGSRGRWSRVRWSRERCGCRPCSSVGKVRWWGMAMGSAPEAVEERVPSSARGISGTRLTSE